MKTLAPIIVAAAFAVACVPKPAKSYTSDEIGSLDSLAELMRIQADKADPLFGKTSFSDEEWALAADSGAILQATAARIGAGFGGKGEYDDGFVDFANKLEAQAKALADAALAKDAAAAGEALSSMKATCSGCHGVYR
jgi:mono/diheme cytochrome c family protein